MSIDPVAPIVDLHPSNRFPKNLLDTHLEQVLKTLGGKMSIGTKCLCLNPESERELRVEHHKMVESLKMKISTKGYLNPTLYLNLKEGEI